MSAVEAVLKYLKNQNRPYSANDITQNLHKEFGKTAIQKALDDLVKSEKINEKTYGKQKVYCVPQENCDTSTMEVELVELDSKINDLTEKLKITDRDLKTSDTTLKDLLCQLTTEEAEKEHRELETLVNGLEEKLNTLSSSNVVISQKDKIQINKDNEASMKEYRKRKRICMDIVNSILENCSKSKKSLLDEIGIETDEDVGCKL